MGIERGGRGKDKGEKRDVEERGEDGWGSGKEIMKRKTRQEGK